MVNKKVLIFALPNFAFLLLGGFAGTGMVYFFGQELLLPVLEPLRYLLIGVGYIAGAIFPPIIGRLSDRTTSKHGRRLPWIIIFTPLTALAFWFITIPAFFKSALSLASIPFIWLFMIISYAIYAIFWNFAYIPYTGSMVDIADPEERTEYSTFFNLIGIAGTLAAYFIFLLLFPLFQTFVIVNLFFIIIMLILVFTMVISLRKDLSVSTDLQPPKEKHYLQALKNRAFLTFELAQSAWNFAFTIILTSIVSIATYILKFDTLQTIFALLLLIGVIAPFFWFWVGKGEQKWGKKKCLFICLVWLGMVFPFTLLFLPIHLMGINPSVPVLIFLVILAGALPGLFVFPYSILMDLIEKREEASYIGANSIFFNISAAAGTFLMVVLLQILGILTGDFEASYRVAFYLVGPVIAVGSIVGGLILLKIPDEKLTLPEHLRDKK